jgi:hypothetical protein
MKNLDTNKKTEPILIGIGDLHGYYPALSRLLESIDEEYAIFEKENKLRPGVKIDLTGDYIDRNNQALKIINRIKKLQKINADSVDALMGNHEIMALRDFDFAKECANRNNFKDYKGTMHGSYGGLAFVSEFDSENDRNAIREYVKRMSREEDVGSWIRSLKPYKIEEFQDKKILFTHADIPGELWNADKLKEYVEDYKKKIMEETVFFGSSEKKYRQLGEPLWGRFFSTFSLDDFDKMLNSLNVNYIIVGHTPSDDNRIKNYNGRIFNIDTGMWHDSCYDPIAIIFKKEGIYEFNANKGEKKLASFE